jgi:CheY-like chemotaxis protein
VACDPDAMALRCLIVDDNTGFLRSARLLLEREGITVVAVASTGDEALRQAEELRPDVLLVDIDLGPESGFELAGRLHSRPGRSPSAVILISTHAEEDFADLIAATPALGFISKSHLSARAIHHLLDAEDDGHRPPTEPRGT